MKRTTCALLLALAGSYGYANDAGKIQPDNSKVNARPSNSSEHRVTADQQSSNEADLDVARKIRRSLTDDESLSTYAQNVKIIVSNGFVTLKGPVNTTAEKNAIETKAKNIAGANSVRNNLEVKQSY